MAYYVSCTDKFLSGWGQAENKTSKFVVVCETLEQARQVERGMRQDSYLSYVRIGHDKPRFAPASRYHVSYKTYAECTRFHE